MYMTEWFDVNVSSFSRQSSGVFEIIQMVCSFIQFFKSMIDLTMTSITIIQLYTVVIFIWSKNISFVHSSNLDRREFSVCSQLMAAGLPRAVEILNLYY